MDTYQNSRSEIKLTVGECVNLFMNDLHEVIYDHPGSKLIKFIYLAIGIEYLGACLDQYDFLKKGESENRFNEALKKLFPNKYHQFAKTNASVSLYEEFRCAFVHQLRPGPSIAVTHRGESKREGTTHLKKTLNGMLILVLEDLFDDFEKACKTLIRLDEKGKLPSKKLEQNYLRVFDIKDNRQL
jgi:hypothetical protein